MPAYLGDLLADQAEERDALLSAAGYPPWHVTRRSLPDPPAEMRKPLPPGAVRKPVVQTPAVSVSRERELAALEGLMRQRPGGRLGSEV